MAFLAPLLGSVIGGLFGQGQQQQASQAGQQAAAAQTEIADTQRQLVNALLEQAQGTFFPLQKAVGQQYQGLAGLPTLDTAKYVVASLLNPNAYRQQTVQSILQGANQQVSGLSNEFGGTAGEGQIAGMAENIGDTAIEGISQANIAANQQQDQRNQAAMQILSSLLGGGGQFSSLGTNLTGQASANLQGLGNMYGNAAAGAQNSLNAMGNPWAGLQGVLQNMGLGLYGPGTGVTPSAASGFGFDPNAGTGMASPGGNQGFSVGVDVNPLISGAPVNPNPLF